MQYQQQQNLEYTRNLLGCDLLENNYLCSISNNINDNEPVVNGVVICLKTTTFAVSATTDLFRL
ncbi:hypothetical protein HMPREF9135_0400 [Segatella baroniae F0067]|uniref:Uncharacterized protein n=1 Tax=Segatella baroniae F0067 TaxID=1115809 RepID=U2P809_9BACT|nr:hypothetical protein HMPREF9135_0400 [Segatella baroniae F0067]